MSALMDWKPLVDLTWGCRTVEDMAQKGMRVLLNTYKTHEETLGTTAEKAWKVVRVILEEAVHRTLLACDGDEVLKSGVCGLMKMLRHFEGVKKSDESLGKWGLFTSFSEANLKTMNLKVREESMRLEDLPTWASTQTEDFGPMRSELSALVQFYKEEVSECNALSWEEANALTRWNGGVEREEQTEGMGWREGPSPFA